MADDVVSTLLTRIRQSVWRGKPSRHDDSASVGEIEERATQPCACFVLIVMNTVLQCIHHNHGNYIAVGISFLFATVFNEETRNGKIVNKMPTLVN